MVESVQTDALLTVCNSHYFACSCHSYAFLTQNINASLFSLQQVCSDRDALQIAQV